jgi:signal peptidase II
MSSEAPQTRGWADTAVLGLTALVIVVADQTSKALVTAGLALGEQVRVVGDLVILWRVENTGSAFSLFQFPGSQLLFFVVTILALALVAYFHLAFRGRGAWLQVLLGIFLGGTLGNFIDRIRLGTVTDFISIGFGNTRFPTWNVADASLTVGLGLLLAYIVLVEPRRGRRTG